MKNNQIFDRKLLKHHLLRFSKSFYKSDFLFKQIADDVIEIVKNVKEDFENVLEVGARDGYLGQKLINTNKIKNITQTNCINNLFEQTSIKFHKNTKKIIVDDEDIDFLENSFDLIVSNLNFHFNNDVVKILQYYHKILKIRGIFINTFFGGATLCELRDAFNRSDLKFYGGTGPRIIPFIDIKSAGSLASKVGFKNVVSDSSKIEVSYSNLIELMHDLRNMGFSNILYDRNKKSFNRESISYMENIMKDIYSDGDDGFLINFEVITVTSFN